MTTLFERPDGSTTKSGYRGKRGNSAANLYQPKTDQGALPPKVDLRPAMTEVEDQGQTSSCVANATAGAYEYMMKRHLGDDRYNVSRLFIYWNARDKEGSTGKDGGSFIADAVSSLREKGACSEETWPFDVGAVTSEPDEASFDEAKGFLVEEAESVATDLGTWRATLADGQPIIFGTKLFGSFDKQRKPGHVPMPSSTESNRESHGAHAMLCVGYSDVDKVFIVRNSWGSSWGDKGYCYMPYDYLMNTAMNLDDSWIIRQIETTEIDQETWGDDDESILPTVDHELAAMDEDDYTAFLDALGHVHFETRWP